MSRKQDKYFGAPVQLADPANEAVAIVADGNDLSDISRGLYVGVSGDISMKLGDNDGFVLFKSVPVGPMPFRVKAVQASGTTATNLLALY